MPAIKITSAIALFLFSSYLPAHAETDSTATELNAFWAEVTRTVAEGDFAAYAATYHPDAVLVSGYKQTSYPIAAALAGWQQGFLDTQAGNMTANVEFRITQRFNGDTTAHERGIFYYSSNSEQGEATDAYIHFEALLVKKDGWKMMMEYQITNASEEEWAAAKQQE
jgi:ketosteroid isomerase-like protein